jgi:hypothetical protein
MRMGKAALRDEARASMYSKIGGLTLPGPSRRQRATETGAGRAPSLAGATFSFKGSTAQPPSIFLRRGTGCRAWGLPQFAHSRSGNGLGSMVVGMLMRPPTLAMLLLSEAYWSPHILVFAAAVVMAAALAHRIRERAAAAVPLSGSATAQPSRCGEP